MVMPKVLVFMHFNIQSLVCFCVSVSVVERRRNITTRYPLQKKVLAVFHRAYRSVPICTYTFFVGLMPSLMLVACAELALISAASRCNVFLAPCFLFSLILRASWAIWKVGWTLHSPCLQFLCRNSLAASVFVITCLQLTNQWLATLALLLFAHGM